MLSDCALIGVGCEAKFFALTIDLLCFEFKSFCIEDIGCIARTTVISSEHKDLLITYDCDEGVTKWEALHTNLIPCSRENSD